MLYVCISGISIESYIIIGASTAVSFAAAAAGMMVDINGG